MSTLPPMIIGGMSAASGILSGLGALQEGDFQASQYSNNAALLRQNAYRKRLETAINEDRTRAANRQLMALNEAASVEQGMAGSATTAGVLGQQATQLEQNALDLRYKGISAAQNMEAQADYLDYMAKMAKKKGKNKFGVSLLTAPLSFAQGFTGAGGTW